MPLSANTACVFASRAIERVPDRLDLHLAKIKLAKLTHQLPMTKDSLNYIVQSASNNLMDNVIKGEAYLALGREQDAVYTFENAINFANNVDDELYLAEILVHNKQFNNRILQPCYRLLPQQPGYCQAEGYGV